MDKELYLKITLPLTPMNGDQIAIGETHSSVTGEFARLQVGTDVFAVEASDGRIYEIEVVERGDDRRGSQTWRSRRLLPRREFEKLGRSPVD